MKKLFPLLLVLSLCGGCAPTNISKLVHELGNDRAHVHIEVRSVYGVVTYDREMPSGPGTNIETTVRTTVKQMITTQNVVESLARGTLPMKRSSLFVAKVRTLVVDISGRNDSDDAVTFNLFTKIAGASIGKIPADCQLIGNYSYNSVLEHPVLLNPNDSIDGDSSIAGVISFEILGFAV